MQEKQSNRKIVKSGFAVSLIVLIGKVLGFVKQAVIAWAFGANAGTDIYFAADGFIAMFGQIQTASISPSVLTEYIQLQEKDKKQDLNMLLRKCFVVFPLIAVFLIILNAILSGQVSILLGIAYTPEQRSELQKYLLYLSPVILFTAFSGVSQGILDANHRFVPSKLLTLFFSTTIISFIILFRDSLGLGSMLIGFLIGYGVHTVYIVFLSHKYFRIGKIRKNDESFRKVLKNVFPLVVGNSIVDLGHLVDKIVASSLTTGSVSYLYYGQVISNDLVNAVVITTIGTVLLPTMARMVATQNEGEAIAARISNVLGLMVSILLFIFGLYIIEGTDLIKLFFERGSFTSEATKNVAGIAICYAAGFVFIAIREILTKAHYAFQDTVTPMKNGIIGVVINSLLSLLLSQYIGVAGVALATSISMAIVAALMCVSIKKHIGVFPLKKAFGISSLKSFISMVSMIIVGTIMASILKDYNHILRMIVIGIVMTVTYFSGLLIMKHDAISQIKGLIKR